MVRMTPTGDGGPLLPGTADVAAAVDGDEVARERVLAALHPLVVRYCRGRLGAGPAAEDAADEIGERVAALLPGTDGAAFLVAVYRVARDVTDTVEDGLSGRGCGVRPRRLRVVPGATAAISLLGRLPADLRDVLVLRVAAGLGVADVAALVGSSVETVRVRQHRALARLRAGGTGQAAAGA
ncbi:MAG: sigma factor-like helix-turn-helix DNA-binding protein [Pseudonocardia sp.]